MSTQINPLASEAAKGVLASLETNLTAKFGDKFAAKGDVDQAVKDIKQLVADTVKDLTQQIVEAKQAPAFQRSKNDWKVRSRVTGNVLKAEMSLGKIFWAMKMQKENGGWPTEKAYEREVDYC